jgi:sporulation protein YlmC with PRC-barrel domain
MNGSSTRVWMADLIGSSVIDRAGAQVGRVVEARLDDRYRVTKVLLGRYAWAQRFHLGRLVKGPPREVPWDQVARFENFRLHLK